MFDATASQNRDIQFEKVDISTHDPKVEQYGVGPIPHAVFLDGGGKVLYSGHVWNSPESFTEMIHPR